MVPVRIAPWPIIQPLAQRIYRKDDALLIRRVHHILAARVIQQHQQLLGRLAFDDSMLRDAIANVCMGHGLNTDELENKELYPELRDIRGEKVNLRFMAILLRLGDLLDMSTDRACPLLLNAASPIPADSYAHWSQYSRITHFAVTPDRIEITAKCENQDEHRVLQDWCTWIVNEVEKSATLMAHVVRHKEWRPPTAKLGHDAESTIKISPAANASYIFRNWTFELDRDAILQRLIYDLYDLPETFVRELIQNALDATRSQMYLDLRAQSIEPSESPTQVEESFRAKYPVKVSLVIREVINESSEKPEKRHVVIVEDCGIGMDLDIIQRYFLQVGRSFYTTNEFRREFRFVPTSRFGLGFLSVFAVSDHVTVETYKPTSPKNDGPLFLTLKGPKNYLLIEKGKRRTNGTRIEVLLREQMSPQLLTSRLSMWCKRVEFPIIVDDLGTQTTIISERATDFTREIPDVLKEGARFTIRAFPMNRSDIEGDLYVLSYKDENGESWAEFLDAIYERTKRHPLAQPIRVPNSLICLHGIALLGEALGPAQISARVDYRSNTPGLTLARTSLLQPDISQMPEINSRREELLREHLVTSALANSEDGWKYKHRLVGFIDFPYEFWHSMPQMIPVYVQRQRIQKSGTEFKSIDKFISLVHSSQLLYFVPERKDREAKEGLRGLASSVDEVTMLDADFDYVSEKYCDAIFAHRRINRARWINNDVLAFDWSSGMAYQLPIGGPSFPYRLVELPDYKGIGFAVFRTNIGRIKTSPNYCLLLNTNHAFVKWFDLVLRATSSGVVTIEQGLTWLRLLSLGFGIPSMQGQTFDDLTSFVAEWRRIPNLPSYLYPPEIELNPALFKFESPKNHKT